MLLYKNRYFKKIFISDFDCQFSIVSPFPGAAIRNFIDRCYDNTQN